MAALGDESIPAPSPGIARREIAGEALLVPISGDLARMQEIFVLDDVADHIWQRLDGRTPVTTIVDSLTEAFEVDRETAHRDLVAFLEALEANGLVTTAGSNDG